MDAKLLSAVKIEQSDVDPDHTDVDSSAGGTPTEDIKVVKQETSGALCVDKTPTSGTQQVSGAAVTEADHLKHYKKAENEEQSHNCDDSVTSLHQDDKVQGRKRSGPGVRPHICKVCDFPFAKSSQLKCHMTTHTRLKPFKCDVCERTFNQSGTLVRHKRLHSNEKLYKCDICGASFARNDHLNGHVRIHTGEKPYKCEICGVSFAHNGFLTGHMRTHTGEKPHCCDICGISFAQSSTLKRHRRTHTGEKPYKCDVCGASFARHDHLTGHLRTQCRTIGSDGLYMEGMTTIDQDSQQTAEVAQQYNSIEGFVPGNYLDAEINSCFGN